MGEDGGLAGAGRHASGRAVLVRSRAEGACTELLGRRTAGPVDLLVVAVTGDASARIAAVRDSDLELARVRVLPPGAERAPEDGALESPESAEALSSLGREVRTTVEEWAAREPHTVLCFDSVTALIERVGLPLTFEFLLVLVDAIRPAEAAAFFLAEPSRHDERTLRTIRHVFDDRIDGGE